MNADKENIRSDKSEIEHIVVKFINEFSLPHIPDLDPEKYLPSDHLDDWAALKERFPGISFLRIYSEEAQANIEILENRIRDKDSSYEGSHLLNYFYLYAPSETDLNKLVIEITEWKIVEFAYIHQDLGSLPNNPINPADPGQLHLHPALEGVDAQHAWPLPGGDGSGMKFIDIEEGWELNHKNFLGNPSNPNISVFSVADSNSIPSTASSAKQHGCSVLGVVAAPDVDASHGKIRGIAFKATGKVVSTIRASQTVLPPVADAILVASNPQYLDVGDVMLIEAQWRDSADKYWPIEKQPKEFAEIKLATDAGIIVIEPAGNGCYGVFDPNSPPVKGNNLNGIIDRNPDSGAILVGSATRGEYPGYIHKPMIRTNCNNESNFGDRVDCYAWGQLIKTTLGIDPDSGLSTNTSIFGSTSGASAMIAGVALVVQGVAKANHLGGNPNGTFTPKELREILGSFDPLTNQPWKRTGNEADPPFGTKSNDPATDLIGIMPDLKKIFTDNTNAYADVYMRDYLQDDGSIPSSGNICASPDIFVRNARVNNLDIALGEKSALRNADNLSEEVTDNNTAKYIYMRVSNRGTAPAAGVKLKIYYASPSTYLTPGQLNLIDTLDNTQTFIVPGGNKMRVAEIVWPAENIPNPGHYCFFGIVESYTDKPPDFSSITNLDSFLAYVQNNNDAAWRNFNVVPINSPGAIARAGGAGNAHDEFKEPEEDEIVLHFFVTGAEFDDAEMRLEIGGDLPPEATIHFEANQDFLQNMLGDNLEVVEAEKELESRIVRAHMGSPDQASQHILPFLFPKDLRVPASLIVHLPEELRTRPYDIFIRQLHKEIEVGRITWRLVPHNK